MKMELDWYKVEPYNKQKMGNVTNEAGIYIISALQKDNSYVARYVGQTNDLNSRLLEHLEENEQNEKLRYYVENIKLKVSYAKVKNQEDRDAIELYLFNFLNPKCNINKPPSDYEIEVNLPNIKY